MPVGFVVTGTGSVVCVDKIAVSVEGRLSST